MTTYTPTPSVPAPAPQPPDASRRHDPRAHVAVVVVHGVADQAPHESVEAIAAMLGRAAPDAANGYAPFVAESVRLQLAPAGTRIEETRGWHARRSRVSQLFDERSPYVSAARRNKRSGASQDTADADGHAGGFAHAFMASQLDEYQSHESAYETRRLVSTREAPDGGAPVGVHVYEAYWADLSRLKSGVLEFLGALYQLLFHLGNLGAQALDFTYLENRGALWAWSSRTFAWTVRLLTLPIALLQLVALVAVLAVVPAASVPRELQRVAIAAVAGLMGTIAACAALWALSRRRNAGAARVGRSPAPWAWLVAAPAGAFAAMAAGLALSYGTLGISGTLAMLWWAVCLAPFGVLVARYERLRPGALVVGLLLFFVAAVAFVAFEASFARAAADVATHAAEYAAMWTFRLLVGALQLCALALALCAITSAVTGWFGVRAMSRETAAARARRARAADACTTARLAIALPTIGFTAVTMVIWTALYTAIAGHSSLYRGLDPAHLEAPRQVARAFDWAAPAPRTIVQLVDPCTWEHSTVPGEAPGTRLRKALRGESTGCATIPADERVLAYFHGLLLSEAGTGFVATLGIVVICLVFYLTIVGPSLVAEVMQPRDAPYDRMKLDERQGADAASRTYGAWLDRGLACLPALTWALWIAAFVVPFAALVPYFLAAFGESSYALALLDEVGSSTRAALDSGAALFVGSGIVGLAVLVLSGVLSSATATLDVVLDVDNYMRTRPVDRTPRARIAERYTSLLRHLAAWRDDAGRGYDHVLFVAHSLGTVITVDLLRYLRESGDDAVPNSPLDRLGLARDADAEVGLHLVTMGSPLRQLFGRFFPHLYGWTRAAEADAASDLPSAWPVGVSHWVNAYRSGDYVGRGLWSASSAAHAYDRTGQPPALDDEGRADWCLGAGAHTHYWDETTPDLGASLDRMVLAIAGVGRPT